MQVEIWRLRGQRLRMDGLSKLVEHNPRPPLSHMASDPETIEQVHDSQVETSVALTGEIVETQTQEKIE